ncbi:hypothetical protein L873DRAFT_1791891 [Choiromyces venosus 120613-1]|uniref:PH domain-containing protein n=1 Tax=Choiromyces venosus 120613-1 TaxID=1336337 RepID=A0A3N4JG72_9PEZI|nr:hypothetical protein L873DRAFT_1791891 [Choiromyces venosus 120613-1]
MPKLAGTGEVLGGGCMKEVLSGVGVGESVDQEEMVDRDDTGSEESISENEGDGRHPNPTAMRRLKGRILPPVPLCPGQIYFSSRFHVKLKMSQQERLGAHHVGTKNKCRKSRPWVIIKVFGDGRALAMCSTTREKKTWIGVTKETAQSFVPVSPTESMFGRPVVHLADDERQVFTGFSLFFLEIQQKVKVEFLGDYIGSLTEEGLRTLRDQRKRWERNDVAYLSGCHEKDENYQDYDEGGEEEMEEEGVENESENVAEGWTFVSRRKRSSISLSINRGRDATGCRDRVNRSGQPSRGRGGIHQKN